MTYASANDPSSGLAGNAIPLGPRIDVYPDMPLLDLNTVGGSAYAAKNKSDARGDNMAIICNTSMPARFNFVNSMKSVDNPCILKLYEGGVVYWPATDERYYALVYNRPAAPRFRQSHDEVHPPMTEDAINHYFIKPMIGALAQLQRIGVTHGGIRPQNIFWREGGASEPQLGECLSTPAGVGQPVLFETIERGMCLPIGRGPGSHSDDCYAFGVTIALLLLGMNPLHGMDDQAIIQAKLERGSFTALIGNNRMPPSLIELLRGLLTDDPRQRWNSTDLTMWLSGNRLTPKSSEANRKASRGLEFMGKEYWQARALATALSANVKEAVKLIEDNTLEHWLTRSLGDSGRTHRLIEAVSLMRETTKTAHYDDQLIARVCIALDSYAPIRYRGFSVMPEGISNMLAEAIVGGRDLQILLEILTGQFVGFWVNCQTEHKPENISLSQQIERIRSILEKPGFGNGLERAGYELNPTLACFSPMLRRQYVSNVKQLLPALERVSNHPERPVEPMDRHIAAFLVVHDKRGEQLFQIIGSPGSAWRRGIALLTLYSEIQYRHGPEELPGLAKWLWPLVEPSAGRFFNKQFQEKVRKQLKEAVDKGNLTAMVRVIDEPTRIISDQQDFLAARMLYQKLQMEITDVTKRLNNREQVAATVGRPMAATISTALAFLLITVAFLRFMLQILG